MRVKAEQTSTGGKGVLEEVGKYAVGCTSESSTGEYTGTKEGKNIDREVQRLQSRPPFVCTSEGHEPANWKPNRSKAARCGKTKQEHKTAFDLFPAVGDETFIEFTCGAADQVAVKGSMLVPIKADTMSLDLYA